jgi:hypothetical protein
MIEVRENDQTYMIDQSYAYIQKCMTYYEHEKERLRQKAKREHARKYVPHPRVKKEPVPKPPSTRPRGRPRKILPATEENQTEPGSSE